MNPTSYAIDMIKFNIPDRLLQMAFNDRYARYRSAAINIDEAMRNLVIRPRVLMDCNLHGGTEAWIDLPGVPYERSDDYTQVYRIPKAKTQNRSIISVLNVTFTDATRGAQFGIAAGMNNSTEMQAANAMMDSYAQIPITSTAKAQLIGENVVMVRDSTILPPNIYLRCVLANDENLSHLQLRSYPFFVQLCEYAVQAYIYNKLVINVDIGEIQGGQVIGRIKEILDEYKDANQLYKDYMRETFQKVLFQNDNETVMRHMKLQTGSYR